MSHVSLQVTALAGWAIVTSMFAGVACSPAGERQDFQTELEDGVATESPIRNPVGKATGYPEAALINMGGGRCSGAVIAPRVAMTAGHCVAGSSSFEVVTPYAKNANGRPQVRRSNKSWTKYQMTGERVNPNRPDVGLIFFDSGEPFYLPQWPKLQATRLSDGARAINIGRKNNGQLSDTNLYVGTKVTLRNSNSYPYAYASADVIENGDSGGPVVLPGGSPHTIVAVNSGSGAGQILARTDAVIGDIERLINEHGGPGQDSGGGDSGTGECSAQEQEPNENRQAAQSFDHGTLCGSFGSSSGEDWYRWTVNGSGVTYDVSVAGSGAQVRMWKTARGKYNSIPNASPERITNKSSGSGTYFILVEAPSGEVGDYTLRLTRSDRGDPGS